MFCAGCGKQLEEAASFCSNCGRAVPNSQRSDGSADQKSMSEICEVIWRKTDSGGIFSGPKARFYAQAIGSGGKFVAAESEEFRLSGDGTIDQDDPKTSAAHENIVHKLIQDGWQPVEGTSAIGFDCKFKRTLSPHQQGDLEIHFFWASWDQLSKQAITDLDSFHGQIAVKRFDLDAMPGAAERYKIVGLPTYLFVKSGKECDRFLGVMPKEKISEAIRRLM